MEYLIKVTVLQIVFYLIYLAFLKSEMEFRRVRFFLNLFLVTSFTVPLIDFGGIMDFFNASSELQNLVYLSPLAISDTSQNVTNLSELNSASTGMNLANIISLIYVIMTSLLAFQVIFGLFRIQKIIQKSRIEKSSGIRCYINDNIDFSFSFFNSIVINSGANDTVILHEKSHVENFHYADNLIFLINRMILWFSPTSWWFYNELKLIHEYEADSAVIATKNVQEYKQTLIRTIMASHGMSLASSFHDGAILKRLKTMSKNKRKMNRLKFASLIVVLTMSTIIVGCSYQTDVSKIDQEQVFESFSQETLDILSERHPGIEFSFIEVQSNSVLTEDMINKFHESNICTSFLVSSGNGNTGLIYDSEFSDELKTMIEKYASQEKSISYELVEKQPEFVGGMKELYNYLKSRVEYPESAKEEGIEGRVFVQFTVDKEGNVRDVSVVKGIDPRLDKIALEAVSSSPRFKPGTKDGKPVSTRMTLPILFSLENEE